MACGGICTPAPDIGSSAINEPLHQPRFAFCEPTLAASVALAASAQNSAQRAEALLQCEMQNCHSDLHGAAGPQTEQKVIQAWPGAVTSSGFLD